MFCPSCHTEYVAGFTRCSDCDVVLVDALPEVETAPDPKAPRLPTPDWATSTPGELVTVLASGDPGMLAIAKSLLQSADIPSLARGESLQDLFGMGRLATGFNLITGPVELQVRPEDASDARQILKQLRAAEQESEPR